jgi:hypothetical protein
MKLLNVGLYLIELYLLVWDTIQKSCFPPWLEENALMCLAQPKEGHIRTSGQKALSKC